MTKTNRSTLRLFGCYYLDQKFDFFINWIPESLRVGLPKTSKQSLPAFTPSISGKTRGDGEKWLWYLDSASLNYPGTDTLVLVIELAEICVSGTKLEKTSDLLKKNEQYLWTTSTNIPRSYKFKYLFIKNWTFPFYSYFP